MGEQARGVIRQRVEGVVELFDRGCVRIAEAEEVRRDHPVPVGQFRDEVAEHERAGREAVQQDDDGSVGRARLPVEDFATGDGRVAVVNDRHN